MMMSCQNASGTINSKKGFRANLGAKLMEDFIALMFIENKWQKMSSRARELLLACKINLHESLQ